jgi:hypothetical protein
MEHLEERHMGRIFVYPLVLSSLLTVSYTASAVLTEDIATDDLIDRLTRSPSEVALPSLPNGSGGVIDDTGVCDNLPRMEGAALLGGFGVLLDNDGNDLYIGAPADTQPFAPGILFFHSSQGFGCDGA